MEGRFYWLKLKRDFFKRHDIRIIEDMPNGKEYILFYLKLLCESVDHNGSLRFSDKIPYSDTMLATITNTNIDIVRSAVKVFTELKMMDVLDDGTFFMGEVEKMIGSAADNDNANRQRRFRERSKTLPLQAPPVQETINQVIEDLSDSVTKCNAGVTQDVTKDNESKNKNIEIDIEKEKDINNMSEFESIWDMYPKKQGKTNAFKAFQKALKEGEKIEDIKAGLQAFKAYLQALNVDSQYIPMGSTWFNQRRWNDDYTITRTRKGNYFAPTGYEDKYARVNAEAIHRTMTPVSDDDVTEDDLHALGIGSALRGDK